MIVTIWTAGPSRKISNANAQQERAQLERLKRMLRRDEQYRVPAPVSLPPLRCLTAESDPPPETT
jgi:hypothetical protein